MSDGQNLVHGKGTSLSRAGLYRFCTGNPWTNLFQGSSGYRFRVGPSRFCGDPLNTTLVTEMYVRKIMHFAALTGAKDVWRQIITQDKSIQKLEAKKPLRFAKLAKPISPPFSSCFHPISMTLLERCTGPTPVQHHYCLKSLEHHRHTTWFHFYFTVSRPGATDPLPKHQASAPSLPIPLRLKSMYVIALSTFNASARALWTKTSPCEFRGCTGAPAFYRYKSWGYRSPLQSNLYRMEVHKSFLTPFSL